MRKINEDRRAAKAEAIRYTACLIIQNQSLEAIKNADREMDNIKLRKDYCLGNYKYKFSGFSPTKTKVGYVRKQVWFGEQYPDRVQLDERDPKHQAALDVAKLLINSPKDTGALSNAIAKARSFGMIITRYNKSELPLNHPDRNRIQKTRDN